ncbi:MAG: helix-turn-helix transcriptional regulator, partial [Pseudomonadota bacterium]
AGEVGMSASTFHTHFKTLTGTTPLQYQKDLRLIRSRDLIESGAHSVSSTAFALGYESPTHFSRDYKRKFGHNPSAARRRSEQERPEVHVG